MLLAGGGGPATKSNTHIYLDLFSVGVLDRRIVAFYPDILYELSRQTALTDTTYAEFSD